MGTSARGLKQGTHAGDKGEFGVTTIWHGISQFLIFFPFLMAAMTKTCRYKGFLGDCLEGNSTRRSVSLRVFPGDSSA